MRRRLLLLALLVTGCSRSTEDLSRRDSSGPDPTDAQVPDRFVIDHFDIGTFDARADAGTRDASEPFDVDIPLDATVTAECRNATIPAPAACGQASCGNAMIDTCETCQPCGGGGMGGRIAVGDAGPGGMCCTVQSEACDLDFAGAACTTRGWGDGRLECTPQCAFDSRLCRMCAAGISGLDCAEGVLDGRDTLSLSVAGTPDRLGVAWVTGGASSGRPGEAHFAVLDAELHVQMQRRCFGPGNAREVALMRAGQDVWRVAIAAGDHIDVLDIDGQGATRMFHHIDSAQSPRFVERSSQTTLLFHRFGLGGDEVIAEQYSPTGATIWSASIFGSTVDVGNAVEIGDGFVASARLQNGVAARFVSLPDGRPGAQFLLDTADTEYPRIGVDWSGAPLATWTNFGGTAQIKLARLAPTGQPMSTIRISGLPDDFNPAPMAPLARSELVVLGSYTGGVEIASHIRTIELDPHDAITPPALLAAAPEGITGVQIAQMSSQLVVAWYSIGAEGRIGFRRIPR